MPPKTLWIIPLVSMLIQTVHSQPATKIYAAEFDDATPSIYSCNLDGSGSVSIPMPMRPKCVAVDWKSVPSKLYVGLAPASGNGKIIRCNTDGTNQEDVVTDVIGINDIELDLDHRKIFWLQDTYNDDRIFHADMDALNSNVTQIYATTIAMRDLWGLALDAPNQRLWITERGSNSYASYIRRMSCTGSGVTVIVSPVDNPHDIEYFNNTLYWGDRDGLERANTDGSGKDTVVGGARINGLAIDGTNNRIYWSDYSDYKVKRVDFDGTNRVDIASGAGYFTRLETDYNPSAAIVEEIAELPRAFELCQNYPNPFNPVTRIRYTVAQRREKGVGSMEVTLVVYDVLGRDVATLVNERQAPGSYSVQFPARGRSAFAGDASGLSSGVYIYRLTAGQQVESRKMVLMK